MAWFSKLAAAAALALALAGTARAGVYASQEQALAEAFPEADSLEARRIVLDDTQAAAVESAAQAKLERRIWTLHEASRSGVALGSAVIDIHPVRTLPEALLVVVAPNGTLRSVRVLAFHEPSEYQAPARWLAALEGRALSPELHLHRDVHAIAGATLSSQAVLRSVRTVLALYQVLNPAAPSAPAR